MATVGVDTLVLSGYAYLALRGARRWRTSAAMLWLERAFGALLVFFGVRLLTATRR